MINSELRFRGKFIITTRYKDGTEESEVIWNRITDVALNALIEALDGTDPDMEVAYLAIGTDNSALSDSDTQLGTEVFRTQDLTSTRTATGEFTTTFTVLDSEAVTTWEEIGIFCGTGATGTANTGTMLSRILYTKEKTSLEEIDITRVDKLERG